MPSTYQECLKTKSLKAAANDRVIRRDAKLCADVDPEGWRREEKKRREKRSSRRYAREVHFGKELSEAS